LQEQSGKLQHEERLDAQQAAQAEGCEASVAEGYGNRRKLEIARQQRRRKVQPVKTGSTIRSPT